MHSQPPSHKPPSQLKLREARTIANTEHINAAHVNVDCCNRLEIKFNSSSQIIK
ncbi:hypothetical protein M758_4G058800 [Ceratodon purpureus]|nr:hypothetical protein M758_4G058800 [Ceratodon purpureus]